MNAMNDAKHEEDATFDIELKLILEAIYVKATLIKSTISACQVL